MNDNVKTVGYLLKHYTDGQCYDQYVSLSWLKEKIKEEYNSGHHASNNYRTALDWVLNLFKE
jgi:hypothetical protein